MSKNSQFEKFINKPKGSVIKEQFKQEKKIAKKERAEAIEKRFEEKRRMKSAIREPEVRKREEGAGKREARPLTTNPSSIKTDQGSEMPVNKFISHSGICSRRDAAILVKQGVVTINGTVVNDPGTKVLEKDIVKVKGRKISPSKILFTFCLISQKTT